MWSSGHTRCDCDIPGQVDHNVHRNVVDQKYVSFVLQIYYKTFVLIVSSIYKLIANFICSYSSIRSRPGYIGNLLVCSKLSEYALCEIKY